MKTTEQINASFLPCLRCGGSARLFDSEFNPELHYAMCDNCRMYSPVMGCEEVVEWWNYRPREDKLMRVVKAVENATSHHGGPNNCDCSLCAALADLDASEKK